MGLKDIFHIHPGLSEGQRNWLRMLASIPDVKTVFGDKVTEEDNQIAEEARSILARLEKEKKE